MPKPIDIQMSFAVWNRTSDVLHQIDKIEEAHEYIAQYPEGECILYLIQELPLPINFWKAVADKGKE